MKMSLISLLILSVVVLYLIFNPAYLVIGSNVIANIRNNITYESIDVGEQKWVYNRAGEGEPLLLLHGFGANKESWNKIMPLLAQRYFVISVDIPGYGESSKDINADYSIYAQVIRLHDFVNQLGLSSFHIAGNSMGGAISGAYAAQYPEQIKSLWLMDPAGVKSAQKSEFDLLFEQSGVNVMSVQTVDEFDRLLTWVYHKPPVVPDYIKRGIIDLIGGDAEFSRKLHADLIRDWTPLEETLSGYKGPVLISWGEADRLTHVSGAAVLHKVLPQSFVHVMPDTGHVPMLEYPQETAAQFFAFNDIILN